MTQMVTRCPKCATAFRITSTQLESAKGSVRCGSCLHIFKAQEYLVNPVTPAAAKSSISPIDLPKLDSGATKPSLNDTVSKVSTPPAKPIIDKAKVLADEEDILISDDMDKPTHDSTYEFDGFIDMDMHPKPTVSLFEREIKYENEPEEKVVTDESWAEQLLDEDDEPTPLKPEKSVPSPTINTQDVHSISQSENLPEDTFPSENIDSYSPPLFSLVNENPDEEQIVFNEEFLKATNHYANEETATNSTSLGSELFEDAEEKSAPLTKKPVKSVTKMRAFDTSRAALLMNIMPAPVEFTAKRVRRWYQQKLWPTLAILAGIALFCQIAYFKFDYFSRVEPYRGAYAFVCPLLGCKVPSLIDTNKILTSNLIIRKHPDAPNALMVDAILINNAPFDQPFPNLTLVFSNLDDVPIASRHFTPNEYLGGELTGMEHIPQHQPVHITIELADPGPEAVNYHMSIP